jgi:hypothetical protein
MPSRNDRRTIFRSPSSRIVVITSAAFRPSRSLRRQLHRNPAKRADGSAVVEGQLPRPEVLGDAAEDADNHRLGQKREQPVGDHHRGPIGGDGVWPFEGVPWPPIADVGSHM